MSDFGLFEAATDAEQEPRRRERIAARQMSAALQEIHSSFGPWIANAQTPDHFEDRWLASKKDIFRILQANQVGQYPAVVREVHGSLKSAWYAKQSERNMEDRKDDPTVKPKNDKDRETTVNDKQLKTIEKGEQAHTDEVKTNTGDGSDSEGKGWSDTTGKQPDPRDKKSMRRHAGEDNFEEDAGDSEDSDFTPGGDSGSDKPHEARRRIAEDRDAPAQDLTTGREVSDALLVPDASNDPSNSQTPGVQRDFTPGADTGSDAPQREAMQLVADLYTDWAQSNRLRVASMNTLDVYAANGLHDDDYYLLAGLIRRAECDCDDKDDSDDNSDSDDSDDGGSESSSSGSDSDSDDSDSGSDESDSDDDSGENPFAASDDSGDDADGPADDDGGNPFGDDEAPDAGADPSAPADDAGGPPEDGGDNPFGDDPAAEDPSAAGPPDVGGPPDAAGQEFSVPEQAPDLPQDEMSQLEENAPQSVPPEVIDDILGLPPGTLEQLITEELSGGGGAPPSGPPPGGPPPQLAARRRRAAEDPTQAAGADPAAAAQPQMPAAPPAGAGSAGTMPPPGSASVAPPPPAMPLENQPAEDALLDTALQSITQMVDKETQEYQQIIDPLTQALQAVQFAQQVEQAENPLDVTPPEGSVDVDPSAAPGGADSLGKQARTARINLIAKRYKLTKRAKYLMYDAMSRKHYEHVGEAIRTLPPELRPGIANHIGGMFKEDNPRFNNDKWLESVGAPRTASRRPFVIRSRKANGGRTAGWLEDEDQRDRQWRAENPEKAEAKDFNESADARGLKPTDGAYHVFMHSAGENLKNTPTLDAFEFPGQGDQAGKPTITDNNKLTDLPKMKGAGIDHEAKGVLDLFDDYTKQRTDKGLNLGDAANVDAFSQEKGPQVGPKALDKLKKTISVGRKQASFFNRRVPGWKWDDHLAGYVSKEARDFTCSCGETFSTPSYGTCRCGKLWNSYAIGDGNHLAANSADMFITREIPVRDDVIVANRQMIAEDRGYEVGEPHSPSDTDWVEDADRENADAPHAPGQTASRKQACWPGCHEDEEHSKKFHDKDDEKTAGLNDAMSLYERHFNTGLALGLDPNSAHERAVQNAQQAHQKWQPEHPADTLGRELLFDPAVGGDTANYGPQEGRRESPSLKDQVRNHVQQRLQNGGFAGGRSANQQFIAENVTDESDGWVKYDDEDPSRQGGPKKPPSTALKGGDPLWHSREPAGKFKSTNPFGG